MPKQPFSGAKQTVSSAEASREDSLLSAKRSVENAESSLAQANEAYSQAQASASLTAQSNAAEAEALRLEKKKNDEKIDLLTSLVETGGLVRAPRDTLLTACALEQGQPCPEGESLQLAKDGSELLVQFSLPADQAEKVVAGQTVTVTQGSASAEATVRRVESGAEEEPGIITAVLPKRRRASRRARPRRSWCSPAPPMTSPAGLRSAAGQSGKLCVDRGGGKDRLRHHPHRPAGAGDGAGNG